MGVHFDELIQICVKFADHCLLIPNWSLGDNVCPHLIRKYQLIMGCFVSNTWAQLGDKGFIHAVEINCAVSNSTTLT